MLKSKTLIPFVMAGFPTLDNSLKAAMTLIEEGVEILEIGIPFSDPLADGPMIQRASHLALKNQVTLKEIFGFVRKIKEVYPHVRIVLFTYLNPLLKYGLANYVRDAKACGADATLTVDLPPEEAEEYARLHAEAGLKTVFLASPTTSDERLKRIAKLSTGFLYYVSRAGVTGEASALSETLGKELARVRGQVSIPVAVGFGISTPKQAGTVASLAEGVVIGSKFIRLMEESDEALRLFVREILSAIRGAI